MAIVPLACEYHSRNSRSEYHRLSAIDHVHGLFTIQYLRGELQAGV